MAIIITDECINCGACEPECPNNAIYEGGIEWAMADGNTLNGIYILENGKSVNVHDKQTPVSNEYYFIVPDKCTECVGFYDEPQCIPACPTEAIIMDPDKVETKEQLMAKKENLDTVGR